MQRTFSSSDQSNAKIIPTQLCQNYANALALFLKATTRTHANIQTCQIDVTPLQYAATIIKQVAWPKSMLTYTRNSPKEPIWIMH